MWASYKASVQGSRDVLIRPWLYANRGLFVGNGVDFGCGEGEFTEVISAFPGAEMVGIDSDSEVIALANKRIGKKARYVCTDIRSNVARSVCTTANFLVGICSMSHIDDRDCNEIIRNLSTDLLPDKLVAMIVTHIQWAKNNYTNVEVVESGIKADARFNGRQWFREAQWYIDTFVSYGFRLLISANLIIPDDARLERRYLDKVGLPLFTSFIFRDTDHG